MTEISFGLVFYQLANFFLTNPPKKCMLRAYYIAKISHFSLIFRFFIVRYEDDYGRT